MDGRRRSRGRRPGQHLVHHRQQRVHSSGDAYDNSDGVVELSPSLQVVQSFAPSAWYSRQRQRRAISARAHPHWCRPTGSSSRRASRTPGTCCRSRTSVASADSSRPSARSAAATSTGARRSRVPRCTSPVSPGSWPWPPPHPTAPACCGRPTPARAGPPSWPGGYVWTIGGRTLDAPRPLHREHGPELLARARRPTTSRLRPWPTGSLLARVVEPGARLRRPRRAPTGAAAATAAARVLDDGVRRRGVQLRGCGVRRLDGRADTWWHRWWA